MPTVEKEQTVAILRDKVREATGMILTEYRGAKASELNRLRAELRAQDVDFRVVKNSLLARALAGTPGSGLCGELKGPLAVAFTPSDSVALAKLMTKVSSSVPSIVIRAGYLDRQLCNPRQIDALSKMPSKTELLASVVSALHSPIYGLAATLRGMVGGIVYALQAIKEKKEAGG